MEIEKDYKCGFDISERGIERILVAGRTAEDQASSFRLLARIAPELHRLNLALKRGTLDCGTFGPEAGDLVRGKGGKNGPL